MPSVFDEPVSAPRRSSVFDDEPAPAQHTSSVFDEAPDEGGGMSSWVMPVAGAAAVGAGAMLFHNSPVAKRVASELLDARQISMLSGLASLKSLLGNAGAAAYASIERGSAAPLRELFSGETVRDAMAAFKNGAQYGEHEAPTMMSKLNVFGRFMGATDEATKNALVRGGLTPDEAQIDLLQRALPDSLAERLDNPVAKYAVPFRRVPFNQFAEGLDTLGSSLKGTATRGQNIANVVSLGQGAVTGYNTDDPTATALSISAGGKRGLGVAAGDVLGRVAKGESGSKAGQGIQGMSPVSDSSLSKSVTQPVTDPLSMFKPAALSAVDKLRAMLGL